MTTNITSRVLRSGALAALLCLGLAGPAMAHEERSVAGYDLEVGLIGEPVSVGDRSGLELSVAKDGQPVAGLESTLQAEVVFGDARRALPISARDEEPGWYESVFYPTAAGPYTFHISGAIEGVAIDETFTSSPEGFDEVHDLRSGQFPVTLPLLADVAADAKHGADASSQVTLALGLGILGVVLGIAGIGIGLATRRKPA